MPQLYKPPVLDDATRRTELSAAVRDLGHAMADGVVNPERVELEALAHRCEEAGLPGEAARIRQWMQWHVV